MLCTYLITNGEGVVKKLYYGNDLLLFICPLFQHLNPQKLLNCHQRCNILVLSRQANGAKMFQPFLIISKGWMYLTVFLPHGGFLCDIGGGYRWL